MVSDYIRKQYNSRSAYVLAFVQCFLLLMLVGTTIIVGTTDIEPRPAALIMLLIAPLIAALVIQVRPLRRLFSGWVLG